MKSKYRITRLTDQWDFFHYVVQERKPFLKFFTRWEDAEFFYIRKDAEAYVREKISHLQGGEEN
jgi:hypothetical protein